MANELVVSVAMRLEKAPAPPAGEQFGSIELNAGNNYQGDVATVGEDSTPVPLGSIAQGDAFYFGGRNLGTATLTITDGEDGDVLSVVPAGGPWLFPVPPDAVLHWNTEAEASVDVVYGITEQPE